ncbi:membrane protein, inferred for ABFAE pathway, partial [hydrothermal vent metagenome]
MDKFFQSTYQSISKNKLWAALALLIAFIGLSAIVSKIQFEEDITKLIPINSENKDLGRVLETVNFTDKIIVNIQLRSDGTVDDLIQYATRFLDSVNTNCKEHIKNIQGKVADDDIQRTMDFVYNNLPFFLEEADYTTIQQKINKDSIAKTTRENYKTLISPSGIVAKKIIVKDPLGLSFIALKKLRQLGIGDGFTLKNGF